MIVAVFGLLLIGFVMQFECVWRQCASKCCSNVRGPPDQVTRSVDRKELIPVVGTPKDLAKKVTRRHAYRMKKGIPAHSEGSKQDRKDRIIKAFLKVEYKQCCASAPMQRLVTILGLDVNRADQRWRIKEETVSFVQLLYLRRRHLAMELITEVMDIATDIIWFMELFRDDMITEPKRVITYVVVFAGCSGLFLYVFKMFLTLGHYRNQYTNGEFHLAVYSVLLGLFEDLPQIICICLLDRWLSLTTVLKMCLSVFMLLAKILTPFLYKPDLCLCGICCGSGAAPLFTSETNFDELNQIDDKLRREAEQDRLKAAKKAEKAALGKSGGSNMTDNESTDPMSDVSVTSGCYSVTLTSPSDDPGDCDEKTETGSPTTTPEKGLAGSTRTTGTRTTASGTRKDAQAKREQLVDRIAELRGNRRIRNEYVSSTITDLEAELERLERGGQVSTPGQAGAVPASAEEKERSVSESQCWRRTPIDEWDKTTVQRLMESMGRATYAEPMWLPFKLLRKRIKNEDGKNLKKINLDKAAKNLVEDYNEVAPESQVAGQSIIVKPLKITTARDILDNIRDVYQATNDKVEFSTTANGEEQIRMPTCQYEEPSAPPAEPEEEQVEVSSSTTLAHAPDDEEDQKLQQLSGDKVTHLDGVYSRLQAGQKEKHRLNLSPPVPTDEHPLRETFSLLRGDGTKDPRVLSDPSYVDKTQRGAPVSNPDAGYGGKIAGSSAHAPPSRKNAQGSTLRIQSPSSLAGGNLGARGCNSSNSGVQLQQMSPARPGGSPSVPDSDCMSVDSNTSGKCPKGHQLHRVEAKGLYGPHDEVVCDRCEVKYTTGFVFHCNECTYDICKRCSEIPGFVAAGVLAII